MSRERLHGSDDKVLSQMLTFGGPYSRSCGSHANEFPPLFHANTKFFFACFRFPRIWNLSTPTPMYAHAVCVSLCAEWEQGWQNCMGTASVHTIVQSPCPSLGMY